MRNADHCMVMQWTLSLTGLKPCIVGFWDACHWVYSKRWIVLMTFQLHCKALKASRLPMTMWMVGLQANCEHMHAADITASIGRKNVSMGMENGQMLSNFCKVLFWTTYASIIFNFNILSILGISDSTPALSIPWGKLVCSFSLSWYRPWYIFPLFWFGLVMCLTNLNMWLVHYSAIVKNRE